MFEANEKDMTQRISRETLNKEVKKIPVVCPWCNQVFSLAECEIGKGEKTGVSHKICPKCLKKVKSSDEDAPSAK